MEVAGKDKNFNAEDAGQLWRTLEKIKTLTLRTLASYGGRWSIMEVADATEKRRRAIRIKVGGIRSAERRFRTT
jgi:hypothetical protein